MGGAVAGAVDARSTRGASRGCPDGAGTTPPLDILARGGASTPFAPTLGSSGDAVVIGDNTFPAAMDMSCRGGNLGDVVSDCAGLVENATGETGATDAANGHMALTPGFFASSGAGVSLRAAHSSAASTPAARVPPAIHPARRVGVKRRRAPAWAVFRRSSCNSAATTPWGVRPPAGTTGTGAGGRGLGGVDASVDAGATGAAAGSGARCGGGGTAAAGGGAAATGGVGEGAPAGGVGKSTTVGGLAAPVGTMGAHRRGPDSVGGVGAAGVGRRGGSMGPPVTSAGESARAASAAMTGRRGPDENAASSPKRSSGRLCARARSAAGTSRPRSTVCKRSATAPGVSLAAVSGRSISPAAVRKHVADVTSGGLPVSAASTSLTIATSCTTATASCQVSGTSASRMRAMEMRVESMVRAAGSAHVPRAYTKPAVPDRLDRGLRSDPARRCGGITAPRAGMARGATIGDQKRKATLKRTLRGP